MLRRIVTAGTLALFASGAALADFSYEQTSQLTGGMMAGAMKLFSKQMREPIRSTVLVKGDRMAHITADISAQIIDLNKETITEIDLKRRTYSVLTFAQWAEALKRLDTKVKNDKNQEVMDIKVKPSVKDTGARRQVAGYDARNVILTMEMEGTDSKTGKTSTFMVMTSDMWVAPRIAGYDEVRHFYARMLEKVGWSPNMGMMSAQPGGEKGMAELMKEMSKLDGVPVYTLTKMGMGAPAGSQGEGAQAQPAEQAPPPRQEPQAEPEKPSVGGALGKLGGRFGGLGGLGKKKKQEDQTQPASSSSGSAPSGGGQQPGSLMEMTSELSGFSSAAVDGSKFEVPAGFKQVESEKLKQMRR